VPVGKRFAVMQKAVNFVLDRAVRFCIGAT